MKIGVEYSQAPERELSFWEKYQLAEILSQFPALTLKLPFRRKVGLRRAEPSHIFVMALLLFTAGNGAYQRGAGGAGLMVFAVVMGIAGYWQQFSRWKELRRGTSPPWHTYSEGISPLEDALIGYLQRKQNRSEAAPAAPRHAHGLSATASLPIAAPAFLPIPQDASGPYQRQEAAPALLPDAALQKELPPWMLKLKARLLPRIAQAMTEARQGIRHVFSAEWWLGESRVYRRLDPFLMYFIGLALFFLDRPLGLWIMFAAACLSINENLLWRHQLRAYLDWYDAHIDAASMREWKGKREGRKVQPKRSRRETYGLPTGIGADIRARVEEQAEVMQEQRRALLRAVREAQGDRPPVLAAPDNRAG